MKIDHLICSLIFLSTMTFAQEPSVHYTLGMSKPVSHLLEVEVTIDRLPAGERTVDFILPVWRPGRYVVLDFAGGVQNFSTSDGTGKGLTWEKVEKSMWRVRTNGESRVTIRYSVYANEFNLRTRDRKSTRLNSSHGYISYAVFCLKKKRNTI